MAQNERDGGRGARAEVRQSRQIGVEEDEGREGRSPGKDSHIHMALFTVSEPRKRKARK